MKAVWTTACDGDGSAVKGSSPVLSIVHSHHLHDEGGSGRGAAARCDGDGRIESWLRRRRAAVSPSVGRPHHGWGTMRHSRGLPRLANARNPPLKRPIQTFPERQSLRRSAHAFDVPSFPPSQPRDARPCRRARGRGADPGSEACGAGRGAGQQGRGPRRRRRHRHRGRPCARGRGPVAVAAWHDRGAEARPPRQLHGRSQARRPRRRRREDRRGARVRAQARLLPRQAPPRRVSSARSRRPSPPRPRGSSTKTPSRP